MLISIELELDLSKQLEEVFLMLEGYGNEFHVFCNTLAIMII